LTNPSPPPPSSTPRCIENYTKFKVLKRREIFQTLIPNLQIFQTSVQIYKYFKEFIPLPEFENNLSRSPE
jgi:hypothetical protein